METLRFMIQMENNNLYSRNPIDLSTPATGMFMLVVVSEKEEITKNL